MIVDIKPHTEFHPNGSAWITGKVGVIAPNWKHLYDYRTDKDEVTWCRLGEWTKHFDNGQLAWTLVYDEHGYSVKTEHPSFRKDGSKIVFS